VYRILIS